MNNECLADGKSCRFVQSSCWFDFAKARLTLDNFAGAKTQLPDAKVQVADAKMQLPCSKAMEPGQKTQAADSKMRLVITTDHLVARSKTERVARAKTERIARAKTELGHHEVMG